MGNTSAKKKSHVAHLSGIGMRRRRQEQDIKLELQKGEDKRKKNKREVYVCVRERDRRSVRVCVRERKEWGEWHKNKSYWVTGDSDLHRLNWPSAQAIIGRGSSAWDRDGWREGGRQRRTSAKRTKREVYVCACGRERNGANGIKIKVIELPETQIYTDSIDHRLKQ